VDGWVVDTALTVNVGDLEGGRPLVRAADEALRAAIAALAPGVEVRAVSSAIERTIGSLGLRPVRNLCGHGVARWTVHCAPPIPNVPDGVPTRLPLHAVIAIEPFATDGLGLVREHGEPQIFRLLPGERRRDPSGGDARAGGDVDVSLLQAIRGFRGLPFARRQLGAIPRQVLEQGLAALLTTGELSSYPPLAEKSGRKVAQAEHTIYLGPDGVEVLTA
jgi:methionyl aminopeptidase